VVGRFAGSNALAAVSSTGSLVNLIVNLFTGLSLGASVLVAQEKGAQKPQEVTRTVHTAIAVAIASGIIIAAIGLLFSRSMLEMMDSPEDVIDLSALYLRIYFIGMPFNMLYNFGAGILRAVGDTKRPLYFLMISGIVNVLLNLLLVIVFNMSVAGVAIATVASQAISATMVILCLVRTDSDIRLDPRRIRIHKDKLIALAKIGLPAGLQGCLFSVSNVLIQSSVNSFGANAMAGNGASANLEGFIYVAMNSIYQAAVSFVSQNVGARRIDRIRRIVITCECCVFVIGLVLGMADWIFSADLLKIYATDPDVLAFGQLRCNVIATTYFICGMMEVMAGTLRGMGYSVEPMVISLIGACGLRILWIFTFFQSDRTLTSLYISYPLSWIVTTLCHTVCYFICKKKLIQRMNMRDGTYA